MTDLEQPDAGRPVARPARVDDLPGMLEVIEAAFPTWPPFELQAAAADYLRWKLGPDGDAAIGDHIVVELDGRVVAVRLAWHAACRVGETACRWENSADMAVHPDFQGLGISRTLNAARLDRLIENGNLSFGAVSPNPQVRHMDQTPWDLRPLTIWTRTRSARSFAATHYRSGGVPQLVRAAAAFARQPRVRGVAEAELPGSEVSDLERFDERTDLLWERARGEFDIVTERRAAYLNWRHLDPRGGATLALSARAPEGALGYAVFKADRDVVKVVDLLVEPGRIAVAAALLVAGVERLRGDGYRQFVCWLPTNHPYDAALRGAGFIATGTDAYIFATREQQDPRPPAIQALLDEPATRFHVTMSDFDFI